MSGPSVAVVDYGVGNLFSVEAALKKVGVDDAVVSSDKDVIQYADRLILPGVGAFGDGMRNLRELDLVSAVEDFADSGRPVLGVCLGMQLLLSESEEFGVHRGLNLVKGSVKRLRSDGGGHLKIPLIGWNPLYLPNENPGSGDPWKGTVLSELEEGAQMYFLHSYVAVPEDPAVRLALTRYGHDSFCAVLKQGNVTGVQFHPERSGEDGLSIYRGFVFDA